MATTDPVELKLIDTDLVTKLGILPVGTVTMLLQLNEPGSGETKIPLRSRAAGLLTSAQFTEVSYRGAVRGGYFIENIVKEQANSGEGEGQFVSISGRGSLALLDDAIVWDDGSGATTRTFEGTKAAVLIQLIQEAQLRGALQTLAYDFSETNDSDAVAWTDAENLELTVGTSLLDVVRQIAKSGIDFEMLPDGSGNFVLSAYLNGVGSNKSGSVYFRVGQNCQVVASEEAGGSIKNALKVKYKNGFTFVSDSASITARRRREQAVNVEYAGEISSAVTFAEAELLSKKNPRKQISVQVYDGAGPRAFVDYVIGDTVTLDIEGVEEPYRIRGMQLSWDGNQFASVVLDMNSLILENEIRIAQDVDWLTNIWKTAHDAGLLEVRFWASIGDPNITYQVNDALIHNNVFYVASGTNLFIYDIENGSWTRVALSNIALCLAAVGGYIYIGCYHAVYRYNISTGAVSSIGTVVDFSEPLSEAVYHIIAFDGNIYCSGTYTSIGGVSITGVGKYTVSGGTWSSIGGGGTAGALAASNDYLYALIGSNVKMWDGATWTILGTAPSLIVCLAAYGTNLLAGTLSGNHIYIWDGSTWGKFGGGVSGAVYSIAILVEDVYIGGAFTDAGNYIAKYVNNEWQPIGDGTNNSVRSLSFHNEDLYIAGDFTQAGGKPALKVAAFFTNFESLSNYLENSSSSFNLAEAIHSATAKSPLVGADEFPFWDSVSQALRKITWTNILATIKTYTDGLYVALTGAQSISGIKTFLSFPVTPSSAPSSDYQVANKKYVDDSVPSITQTPNRVVVSDAGGELNTDSRFVFDPTTRKLIHGATSTPIDGDDSEHQVAEGASIGRFQYVYSDTLTHAPYDTGVRAGGTKDSPTAVVEGMVIRRWRGRGFYSSADISDSQVEIRAVADGDWDGSQRPTRMELWITPAGSTTMELIATINSSGIDLAAGKAFTVDGSPISGSSIPVVTSDPVSPADGELWLLRETSGAVPDGTPIGLLLALTYTGNTGTTLPLQLSVWDDVTNQIVRY